jgi:leucyl-tRNA synthetase
VHQQNWPGWDEALAQREVFEVAVQVNGKTRAVITVDPDADEDQVRSLAFAEPKVKKFINGKEPARVVYVPGKVLNIVVK